MTWMLAGAVIWVALACATVVAWNLAKQHYGDRHA